jgi:hypothetical protein
MLLLALGCGDKTSSNLISVAGTVTLDGAPLASALVTFLPHENIKGGFATTDAAGKYQAFSTGGQKGLMPGRYKVTINHCVTPDGKPSPPDVVTPGAPARETLPAQYSDMNQTTLTANVPASGGAIDFALKSAKKP